jgi:hypothetical protein
VGHPPPPHGGSPVFILYQAGSPTPLWWVTRRESCFVDRDRNILLKNKKSRCRSYLSRRVGRLSPRRTRACLLASHAYPHAPPLLSPCVPCRLAQCAPPCIPCQRGAGAPRQGLSASRTRGLAPLAALLGAARRCVANAATPSGAGV